MRPTESETEFAARIMRSANLPVNRGAVAAGCSLARPVGANSSLSERFAIGERVASCLPPRAMCGILVHVPTPCHPLECDGREADLFVAGVGRPDGGHRHRHQQHPADGGRTVAQRQLPHPGRRERGDPAGGQLEQDGPAGSTGRRKVAVGSAAHEANRRGVSGHTVAHHRHLRRARGQQRRGLSPPGPRGTGHRDRSHQRQARGAAGLLQRPADLRPGRQARGGRRHRRRQHRNRAGLRKPGRSHLHHRSWARFG